MWESIGEEFGEIWMRIWVVAMLVSTLWTRAQDVQKPLPEIRGLMMEVTEHQKQLEKVRENYTYNSMATTEDLDSNGKVKKTEVLESECFYVHGHVICREVKKDGKALDEGAAKKETERVTKLVEKAEKTPSDQPLEGQAVSVRKILEIMDVQNERRENFRGRPTIIFDFVGRKDAKTSGIAEDASKKLKGTIWVDEADRQIAHLEASFMENFTVGGGLVASVQKGSNFKFDQADVNGELWLPTVAEGNVNARIFLVKGMRQHYVEKETNYQRFKVDAEQKQGQRD
jgi:hypothetical protein